MPFSTDIRSLTEAILDLYKNVTTTLFIFVDFKPSDVSPTEDENNLFNLLNGLFEAYKTSQIKRFQTATALADIEEEEQISDLVSLLQIVSSSITKPYMLFTTLGDSTDQCEIMLCQKSNIKYIFNIISILALEMVLPLLNEDALRLPTLSNVFFRLILNISEASPTVFLMLDDMMSQKMLQCLCWAINGSAGLEPTKMSLEIVKNTCHTLAMSTETERGPYAYAVFNILAGVSLSYFNHLILFRSCLKLPFIALLNWK
jgi:hypothetical protein